MCLDEDSRVRIDGALRSWRQGDCVVGTQEFLFRLHPDAPISKVASLAAEQGADAAEAEVRGFAVLTPTCDLVRRCDDRPFAQVSPLVEVDTGRLNEIQRGRRPNYAFIPGTADHGLVADLDRVMTVEKAVIAGWTRLAGAAADDDDAQRHLRLALMRNRGRAAFPDDFGMLVEKLRQRLSSKHDKKSAEGRALQALREIRVRAEPSWLANEVKIVFWFIRDDATPDFEERAWHEHVERWLKLVPPDGRFTSGDGDVRILDELTARDYVESDPLDLDHLSTRVGNDTHGVSAEPGQRAAAPPRESGAGGG